MSQNPHSDPYQQAPELAELTLGKSVSYQQHYAPELLQPVPRSLNRDAIALAEPLPFHGVDLWTAYELSWLNSKGKPMVALAEVEVDAHSLNLIESKSFKLYLNSLNQTKFESVDALKAVLTKDLSECAAGKVEITLIEPKQFSTQRVSELAGHCIDDLDIEITDYSFSSDWLIDSTDEKQMVAETLSSNLLKSNCLITSQPDWGSVMIRYQGPKINRESLLRYLISFRQHNEFHEQCVERIFSDLKQHCHCSKLTVYARYTRRGGLDINPFRSDFEQLKEKHRLARQ
ncbi:NADPH-dependent 7-cyano-7-deazaguanine reductase QueF [Shewanella avicenniae]|uniref:NADPH-dependent 7-cyano-7-deazaguanine reductase n=1 Tax=Shewanella avicenniae TaxID=2814294 RepID=A0ABX7QNM0_9GAMM|nr:NADPH-dependent 7-cyano-7-deazaguanine reductase QueF [Shewanella avicenniae]QSX32546.1 NADPH-dependent 7-cyano-7-deazaguanine reductase QueF [Shewanella avicenniae]